MAAFLTVIPIVQTIVNEMVKAIDAKKAAAAETAKSKAISATKDLDATVAKAKHPAGGIPAGAILEAAQKVAADSSDDAVETVKAVAIQAGQEAAKVPNQSPQKLYSEAQRDLSQQLQVLVEFLGSCFQAEDEVIRMQALLEAKSGLALSSSDKRLLCTWWETAAQSIGDLRQRQESIQLVDSVPTQETLLRLFDPESVDVTAIDHQVKALSDKSDVSVLAEMNQSLASAKRVLNDINNLALIVMKDFVKGLADVSNAGGASSFEEVQVSAQTSV